MSWRQKTCIAIGRSARGVRPTRVGICKSSNSRGSSKPMRLDSQIELEPRFTYPFRCPCLVSHNYLLIHLYKCYGCSARGVRPTTVGMCKSWNSRGSSCAWTHTLSWKHITHTIFDVYVSSHINTYLYIFIYVMVAAPGGAGGETYYGRYL